MRRPASGIFWMMGLSLPFCRRGPAVGGFFILGSTILFGNRKGEGSNVKCLGSGTWSLSPVLTDSSFMGVDKAFVSPRRFCLLAASASKRNRETPSLHSRVNVSLYQPDTLQAAAPSGNTACGSGARHDTLGQPPLDCHRYDHSDIIIQRTYLGSHTSRRFRRSAQS